MFFRFPVFAAAAVAILAAAGGARATMPMLSSEPFPASPAGLPEMGKFAERRRPRHVGSQ
jgi:hypothetical protein